MLKSSGIKPDDRHGADISKRRMGTMKMWNLGGYRPFVKGSALLETVYQGLAADLEAWNPSEDDMEGMSEADFSNLIGILAADQQRWQLDHGLSYHVPGHFWDVQGRVRLLMDMSEEDYPKGILQAASFFSLGHDTGHPGRTLREDAISAGLDVLLPRLTGVSNEFVSAVYCDQLAKVCGMNPGMRLVGWLMIIATTFGAKPPVEVSTQLEKIIALADVAPDLPRESWITQQHLKVVQEAPEGSPMHPTSVKGHLDSGLFFCRQIVAPRMAVVKVPYGWGANLQERVTWLQGMRDGELPADYAVFETMVTPYL
jgi:hypothetical protein